MNDYVSFGPARSPFISDRKTAEELCNKARENVDVCIRHRLFQEAVVAAARIGDSSLELRIMANMVLFQIGSGYARELIGRFWPSFRSLVDSVRRITDARDQHLIVWSAERILYYAVDFPEIPVRALDAAFIQWLRALEVLGGYTVAAGLRLQLHHALQLNRNNDAVTLFAALERAEPESELRPSAGRLPGETDQQYSGGSSDFGCGAYANQVRVLYHCAVGDARSAWRAARYLVEGRSACELSLCAVAPREAFAALLDLLDQAGMHDEEDRCHALGLPLVKGNSVTVGWLGHHLRYLVRRGLLDNARSLLGDSLRFSAAKATPFQRFLFLRGAIAVLKDSRKASDRDLALEFRSEATELAERFDRRNGNRQSMVMIGSKHG